MIYSGPFWCVSHHWKRKTTIFSSKRGMNLCSSSITMTMAKTEHWENTKKVKIITHNNNTSSGYPQKLNLIWHGGGGGHFYPLVLVGSDLVSWYFKKFPNFLEVKIGLLWHPAQLIEPYKSFILAALKMRLPSMDKVKNFCDHSMIL